MAKHSDKAIGAISGFLFQFERALLSLSALKKDESLTIEAVDDIAIQRQNGGPILISMQAKHSMSCNSSFKGNSKDVWRTLQIWVEKLKSGVFNKDTEFICVSNNQISTTSILRKLSGLVDKESILTLLSSIQKEIERNGSTPNNQKILNIINYIIENIDVFSLVCKNLKIEKTDNIKEQILSNCNCDLESYTQEQLDSIYAELYGWFIDHSSSYGKQNVDAAFSRSLFSQKLTDLLRGKFNAKIIFRPQKDVEPELNASLTTGALDRTFCKQIAELYENPDAAAYILEQAISDFLCSEIEIVKIINAGVHTKSDFNDFKEMCLKECLRRFWMQYNKKTSSYSEEEKVSMALNLYNSIIDQMNVPFSQSFDFTYENRYIQNGTVFKLTDEPIFGWHIDWKLKYQNETD